MKASKLVFLAALILFFAGSAVAAPKLKDAPAQTGSTGHSATIAWGAPSDAVTGSTYNVYRASGVCPATAPGSLTFTKLTTTSQTALNYTDSTITVGAWCFYVTQVQNSAESNPSIPAGGTARPNTVTITVVVQ